MRPRKLALVLVLVGVVCLPAPLYLGWAGNATAPPRQTSQVYAAEPLPLANDTARERIVDRHATAVALSTHQVSSAFSAGEYRAPNETRATLTAAMTNGSATTTDSDVKADLREIARNNTFVHDAYDHREQYYRLTVEDNGSVVRTRPVSTDRVANATIDRATFEYATLSPGEKETVDAILANSTEDDWGYRPRVDDPFVDELPTLVTKEGTLYSITVTAHVDDLGPGFTWFFYGMLVAGGGLVFVLAGGGVYAFTWWQNRA